MCWLNSDDWYLPNGLTTLFKEIEKDSNVPAVYGKVWNINERTTVKKPVWVEPFDGDRLTLRCIISQPATLIRRTVWEEVGGRLHMAMDYDLWWRIYPSNFNVQISSAENYH